MPLSNFPYGVTSFGLPIMGAAPSIPVGMDSKYYFVDPTNGSDGNSGTTVSAPYKTILKAKNQLRSGHWDGVFLIGYGSGAASAIVTATLAWDKDFTFLVGLCAPTLNSQRARISNGLSTTLVTPLVTISAQGCIFKNIQFYNGGNHATTAAVCLNITGQRNYFENCGISGGGTVASAGNAACRDLVIDGGASQLGENNFVHCTIGLDSILRNAVNYSVEIKGHSPRNVFQGCLFDHNGVAGSFFLLIGAGGVDRFTLFDTCTWYNYTGNGGAALTNAYSINAAAGGDILMQNNIFIGATALPASALVWAGPLDTATNAILKGVNPA